MTTTTADLTAAVDAALDSIIQASPDNATSFACGEAERIAELFRAVGRDEDADQFIQDHAEDDDAGDLHRCGTCEAILTATDGTCPEDPDHDTIC